MISAAGRDRPHLSEGLQRSNHGGNRYGRALSEKTLFRKFGSKQNLLKQPLNAIIMVKK